MPIHDWTRVRVNRFHDFHQSWTIAIRNALNAGRLPPGYFAMIEQKAGRTEADVITRDLSPPPASPSPGVAVAEAPPKARFVTRSEAARYAPKANRITSAIPTATWWPSSRSSRRETRTAAMPSAPSRGKQSSSSTPR